MIAVSVLDAWEETGGVLCGYVMEAAIFNIFINQNQERFGIAWNYIIFLSYHRLIHVLVMLDFLFFLLMFFNHNTGIHSKEYI